jgi:hypothetical protein
MKKHIALLSLALTTLAQAVPVPPNIFDPGNACLIVGRGPVIVIDQFILRTYDQQQAALTFFDAFPAGTLNAQAGVSVILKPGFYRPATKMSALGLTVGNLDALSNWSPGLFAGIIGIAAPDVLAFGGSNFIDDVGITGSPVQFYVQTYDHTGLFANRFITDSGIAQGYRLGFTTEPIEPFTASDQGSTFGLLLVSLLTVFAVARKKQAAHA